MPHRQFPLLVADGEHRLHELPDAFRLREGEERVCRAVGVPQRKDRVVVEVGGAVDLPIGAAVVAVEIVEQRRRDHGVIEGRIEDAAGPIIGLDPNAAELLVPGGLSGGGDGIEIRRAGFLLEIRQCVLLADRRDADPHQNLARGALVGADGPQPAALSRLAANLAVSLEDAKRGERLGRLQREEDTLILRPPCRPAVADDRVLVDPAKPRFDDAATAVLELQIDRQMRLLVGRIAVAVQADPLRGGQRDVHVVVEQHDRIEAGAGLFLVVGVAARVSGAGVLARAGVGGQFAGVRHHQDVTQVGDTGAAEV